MLVHNADITGSLSVNGTQFNTGSFSGSFTGIVAGTTATASYVEYNSVANKPALVSGSSQITYSGLTGIPSGIVSGSAQVTYSGLTGVPSGIVSGSAQVTYSGLTGVPSGIVSGSAQIADFGIFATTGSNGFNGSQSITGSLTVTGQVVAQTLNVQQVTSSIVYSSGSNIFGNTLGNTQQFTGSVGVTGSLTVNGTSAVIGTGTTNYLPKFTGASTIGNSLVRDDGSGVSIGIAPQTDKLFIYNSSGSNNALTIQQDGTGDIIRFNGNGGANRFNITQAGAATFSSTLVAKSSITVSNNGAEGAILSAVSAFADGYRATLRLWNQHTGGKAWEVYSTNDADGLYGGGKLAFVNSTNSVNALVLTSTGAATLTTTDNQGGLLVTSATDNTTIRVASTTTNGQEWRLQSTGGTSGLGAGKLVFKVGTTETASYIPLTLTTDNSTNGGRVGIGTTSPAWMLEINKDTTSGSGGQYPAVIINNPNALGYSACYLFNGATNKGGIEYSNSENLMRIQSSGASLFVIAGTERMRITSGGDVLLGATSFPAGERMMIQKTEAAPLGLDRRDSDGGILRFYQDGAEEGNVTISGTTVSYNGGHLSRYSQTLTNTKIEGLVKGTVMSNLDQMAVWINPETGEPYPNEQLNCMKISDIEGDPNVAGVFVNWDNDDQTSTNDMNIAMTGDMIIRIAQDVTIQRGNLLISAGDGTAKPQSDDIIRNSTIAKVTSTHVTCTYEDGSYCVPCVLMAC